VHKLRRIGDEKISQKDNLSVIATPENYRLDKQSWGKRQHRPRVSIREKETSVNGGSETDQVGESRAFFSGGVSWVRSKVPQRLLLRHAGKGRT